jgi:isopentenyl phosphate kinase
MNNFHKSGLPVISVQPSSVIKQNNGQLKSIYLWPIEQALDQGLIPVLYGDLVPDLTLNFSICSADVSSAYLANVLNAERLLFGTDVDGIYTNDPYHDCRARLINKISLHSLARGKVIVGSSHSRDVTAGMAGKLRAVSSYLGGKRSRKVIIFNGQKSGRLKQVLADKPGPHTVVTLK